MKRHFKLIVFIIVIVGIIGIIIYGMKRMENLERQKSIEEFNNMPAFMYEGKTYLVSATCSEYELECLNTTIGSIKRSVSSQELMKEDFDGYKISIGSRIYGYTYNENSSFKNFAILLENGVYYNCALRMYEENEGK